MSALPESAIEFEAETHLDAGAEEVLDLLQRIAHAAFAGRAGCDRRTGFRHQLDFVRPRAAAVGQQRVLAERVGLPEPDDFSRPRVRTRRVNRNRQFHPLRCSQLLAVGIGRLLAAAKSAEIVQAAPRHAQRNQAVVRVPRPFFLEALELGHVARLRRRLPLPGTIEISGSDTAVGNRLDVGLGVLAGLVDVAPVGDGGDATVERLDGRQPRALIGVGRMEHFAQRPAHRKIELIGPLTDHAAQQRGPQMPVCFDQARQHNGVGAVDDGRPRRIDVAADSRDPAVADMHITLRKFAERGVHGEHIRAADHEIRASGQRSAGWNSGLRPCAGQTVEAEHPEGRGTCQKTPAAKIEAHASPPTTLRRRLTSSARQNHTGWRIARQPCEVCAAIAAQPAVAKINPTDRYIE